MPTDTKQLLWLGEGAPPAQLVAYLRERGYVFRVDLRSSREDTQNALPPQRIAVFEELMPRSLMRPNLGGRRIALIEPDAGNADSLAQALRAKGAEVVALSVAPESFQRAELLDPDVVLIDPQNFYGVSWELVQQVWQHPRLRWATVLLTLPESLGFGGMSMPDIRSLCAAIQALCAEADRLRALARAGEYFVVPLHRLGPARTLRLLVSTARPLRAEFASGNVTVDVDAAKELIVGARGVRHGVESEPMFGPSALAACVALSYGEVAVRPVDHPEVANVMAPLDAALHMAQEAREQDTGDNPTRPQLFDDTPTQTWDGGNSGEGKVPLDLLRQREGTSDVKHLPSVLVLTSGDGEPRVYESGPRAPIDTVPIGARPWLRTSLRGLAAVGVLSVLGLFVLYKRENARPSENPPARAAQVEAAPVLALGAVSASTPQSAPPANVAASDAVPSDAGEADANDELAAAEDALDAQAAHTPLAKARALRAAELARKGNTLRMRGAYTEAAGKYHEALELSANCPQALVGLARLSLVRNNVDDAVKYAKLLVRARPGQAVYQLVLGDAYRAAGKLVEARATWRLAARLGNERAKSRLAAE